MPHRDQSDEMLLKPTPLAQELQPKYLMAIYKIEQGKTYIEVAKVDRKGRVLSFAPISTRAAFRFAEGILRIKTNRKASGRIKGWINGARIIQLSIKHEDDMVIAWRRERGKVTVRYAPELGISDGEIDAPGIIFQYNTVTKTLHVWAYREWKSKATQLYHLPFHNVYSTGAVCMGSNRTRYLKSDTLDSFMDRVEWLFFNTAASEIHFSEGWKGNINTLHKKLREGEPFPLNELIPSAMITKLLNMHINDTQSQYID